ncbi:MAG: hypothetical protein K6E10_08555 [Eubacterium sp.]|nr:hypothetical protein [Eubacterium sp.]
MPFIEGKVPTDKQGDFVIHMQNCEKCREELEIYYTLLVGMKQLDNNEDLSTDFSRDLERELKSMSKHVKSRKRVKVSAFSIFMSAILVAIAIFYAGSLRRVYSYEQFVKTTNQEYYYFSDNLSQSIMNDHEDAVTRGQAIDEDKVVSSFDRIKGYRKLEEDYLRGISIGEELCDIEIITD